MVTEEDLGIDDDEECYEPEEKDSQRTGLTSVRMRGRFTREQAALLIQKMWRGYQTRKLVNRYILLLNQKKVLAQSYIPEAQKANFNKTKKYKKRSRQLSDLVDMEKTQKIPSWKLQASIEQSHTFKSEESPQKGSLSSELPDWS